MGVSEYSNDYNKKSTSTITQSSGAVSAGKTTPAEKAKPGNVPIGQSIEPDKVVIELLEDSQFTKLSRAEKKQYLEQKFPAISKEAIEELLTKFEIKFEIQDYESNKKGSNLASQNEIFDKLLIIAEKNHITVTMSDFNALVKVVDAILNNKEIGKGDFAKALKPFAQILDVMFTQTDTENWSNLSAREKLDKRLDTFLDLIIEQYEKKDDIEKNIIRNGAYEKISELLFPDSQNLSDSAKDIAKGAFAKIFEIAENKNVNIETLLNDPEKALTSVAEGVLDEWLNSNEIDYNSDDWRKANTETQLKMLISSLVKQLDPSISEEAIANMTTKEITTILNPIGMQLFPNNWEKDPVSCLNAFVTKFAAFKYCNEVSQDNPISAKEFLSDPLKQTEVLEKYEAEVLGQKFTPLQQIQRILFKENLKNTPLEERGKVKQPSLLDMKKFLENKIQDKNLSNAEREYYKNALDQLNIQEETLRAAYGDDTDALQNILEESYPPIEQTGAYELNTKYRTDEKGQLDFEKFVKDRLKLEYGIDDPSKATEAQISKILNEIRNLGYEVEVGKIFGLDRYQVGALLEPKNAIIDFSNLDDRKRFEMSDILAHNKDRHARKYSYITLISSGRKSGKTTEEIAAKTDPFLTSDDKELNKDNAEMIGQTNNQLGYEPDFIASITTYILNNPNIDTEIGGTLLDSTIKNAADDEARNYYGNHFADNVQNPDLLEYLAAASKYVTDPEKRNQYNSYVTEAAKSYPPSTQATIKSAMETGTVSSSHSTGTTGTTGTTSSTTTSSTTQNYQTTVTTSTIDNTASQTYGSSATVNTPETTTKPQVQTQTQVQAQTSTTQTAYTQTTSKTSDTDKAYEATTAALQQKKDATLDRIQNYQEEVKAKKEAEEITEAAIEEFVDAITEIEATDDPTKINRDKITKFIESNSIGVIYAKLIEKFGNSILSKLISAVAMYGSTSKIDALASLIKSSSLMEELFAKCQSKRLLDRLSSSTVKKFLPHIKDLSAVKSSILYEFIMDLINSNASMDEIKKYLNYLPFGMQVSICDTYNNLRGTTLDSEIALTPQRNNETTKTEQPKENETAKADTKNEPQTKPAIAANELTAVRNDGVTIKRTSTFAGISDQYDEDAYEVVDDKTGKNRSQREEILTPGSEEWLIKYNRQAPKTAFTMAALEEYNEDDEGIGVFGSTKVGMGQKIKKKYPPQSFRFKA